MTAYYLQQWEKGGRLIIDSDFPQSAHSVKEAREASCWLEAKKAFGFELSPLQQLLLERFKEKQRLAA